MNPCEKHHNVWTPGGYCPVCLLDERDRYREALEHIRWMVDCGIDGRDESGVYRNHSDEERDEMYRIAGEALGLKPTHA